MKGWHWKLHWLGPVVNIPYWPHRIIVTGLGHCTKRGNFYRWLPSCGRMHLNFCCDTRKVQYEQENR